MFGIPPGIASPLSFAFRYCSVLVMGTASPARHFARTAFLALCALAAFGLLPAPVALVAFGAVCGLRTTCSSMGLRAPPVFGTDLRVAMRQYSLVTCPDWDR